MSMDIDALIAGKSKSGVCLIDSSDNGETMKKVLRYCVKKNFTKVCVIDPSDIQEFGYVPCINPIRYDAPTEAVEGHLMDSIRVLWGTKDDSETARISKFLPRIFRALHAAGMTLPDSECFTIQEWRNQRERILQNDKLDPPTRLTLERVYKTRYDWSEFESTARRLNPFYTSTMKLLFGSTCGKWEDGEWKQTYGLNFQKLITDGWVILANLYPGDVFGQLQQRLLGTILLNELIVAMSRLTRHGYAVPFYIYIDEVGHYATRKLSDILDYKRKSFLRLTIAHQRFDQIEDKMVLSAVKSSAKTKVLFYTANPDDRLVMVKQMYGGGLTDREVSWALAQTKKQHAVIKINKMSPVSTRLKDWPDAKVTHKELNAFLQKLYTTNPQLYRKREDVWGEIKTRFATSNKTTPEPIWRSNLASATGSHSQTFKRRKRDDGSTARKGNTIRGDGKEVGADKDNAQTTGQSGKDLPVSPDLRPDYTDARPFRKRRSGSEEQGSEREGGES